MIPKNLTCEEVGAYLEVIGNAMRAENVCAVVIINEARESIKNDDEFDPMLIGLTIEHDIDDDRVRELIAMELEEAINFNPEA
jgi:hypothetical protein